MGPEERNAHRLKGEKRQNGHSMSHKPMGGAGNPALAGRCSPSLLMVDSVPTQTLAVSPESNQAVTDFSCQPESNQLIIAASLLSKFF